MVLTICALRKSEQQRHRILSAYICKRAYFTSQDIDFPLEVLPGGGMKVGVDRGFDFILVLL